MRRTLLVCALLSITCALLAAAADDTVYGYVSCSICGTKGASESHRDCVEKCLAKGADIVLIADNTGEIVHLDNPETVSGHHGHRVALTGYFTAHAFHVLSVRTL